MALSICQTLKKSNETRLKMSAHTLPDIKMHSLHVFFFNEKKLNVFQVSQHTYFPQNVMYSTPVITQYVKI